MVSGLEQKLKTQPNDVKDGPCWAISYGVLAASMLPPLPIGRAAALAPNNAQVLADYADVLAMAQGKNFQASRKQSSSRH